MPAKEDVVRANRKKKQQYDASQKLLKFLKVLGITVLVCAIAFTGAIAGIHHFQTQNEIKSLTADGFYNQINISHGQTLNAILHGNADSAYTIVPIHDIGDEDFNIAMKSILEPIDNAVQYALIHRPGHGFSKDTKNTRTSEIIVSEYRQVLDKMNVENKLILVANGFGGIYANYWASQYPDEIAGIVYIGYEDYITELGELEIKKSSTFDILSCKIGFKRFSNFDNIRTKSNLTDSSDSDVLKSMYIHSCKTNAKNTEIDYAQRNYKESSNIVNQIPKVIVSSIGGFDTRDDIVKYIRFKNKQNESMGLEKLADLSNSSSEEYINNMMTESGRMFSKVKTEFVNTMSNAKAVKIAGEPHVYRYNPYAVQDLIKDFILYVNGNTLDLKNKYTDTHAEGWQQNQEQTKESSNSSQ